jgi:DNA-binding GntR family transcriptional regulator
VPPADERDLVAALRRGDEEALVALVRRHNGAFSANPTAILGPNRPDRGLAG